MILLYAAALWTGFAWTSPLAAREDPATATKPPGDLAETDNTDDEASKDTGDKAVIMEEAGGFETLVVGKPHPRETSSEFQLRGIPLAVSPRRSGGEMLRSLPGLVVVQHGSEGKGLQFFLRGFDAVHGSDIEVSVSGIPINETSSIHAQGYLDLGFVIPEAVTGIHIVKGPFGIDQGPFATAGSIQYELGVPRDSRGVYIGYETGITNRHRVVAMVSPKDPADRTFLVAEGVRDNGFGENRAIRRLSIMGRFPILDSCDQGRLDLLISAHGARFGLPGLVKLDDVESKKIGFYDAIDRDGNGRSDRGFAALNYRLDRASYGLKALAWGMVRHLSLNQNFTGFLNNPEKGDRYAQFQHTLSGGIKASGHVSLHPTLTLQALGGYRIERLDQSMDLVDPKGSAYRRTRDLDGYQHLVHAGIALEWKPIQALRFGAGLRADVMSVSAHNHVDEIQGSGTVYHLSPRFTMSGRPGGGWTLFASYGQGWRPPEAAAFAAPPPAGDEDTTTRPVRGTSSHVAEIGVHWDWRRLLHIGVTGFGVFITNEQLFNHAAGTSDDIGGTRRLGIEAVVSSSPLSWLDIEADLTWVRARITSTGEPIPGVPPLAGSIRVSLVHPLGFRFGTQFTALASRPLAFGAKGATMYRLDLTAGFRWQWLDVGFEIDNVLGQEIREGEYNFASRWDTSGPFSRIPTIHLAPGPPFTLRGRVAVLF
ncbi:MAG: TonB-dependent receptor [Deltaproteobacteria bacterium]|nr:TonB-dependent receptor [Deltaproteobacteria bacterium]